MSRAYQSIPVPRLAEEMTALARSGPFQVSRIETLMSWVAASESLRSCTPT